MNSDGLDVISEAMSCLINECKLVLKKEVNEHLQVEYAAGCDNQNGWARNLISLWMVKDEDSEQAPIPDFNYETYEREGKEIVDQLNNWFLEGMKAAARLPEQDSDSD